MKRIFIILISLMITSNVFGQELLKITKKEFLIENEPDSGAWKKLQEGVKLYNLGTNFSIQAAEKLIEADTYNPELAKLKYNIGLCYLYSATKINAINYFEAAIEKNEFVSSDVYFLLARTYQLVSNYKKAIENYESYKLSLAPTELAKIESSVDFFISECFKGEEFMKTQQRVYVDNLGEAINSAFNDYYPFFDVENNQLIYTSQKPLANSKSQNTSSKEEIFTSTVEYDEWGESTILSKNLSSKDHDALVGLSADGKIALIYKGSENNGDLFISQYNGTTWSKLKSLGSDINTKKYKENSATISNDGLTLYFTSNREGGFGGLDIYMCQKKPNGKWGPAQNLGSVLNSTGNETSVSLSPDDQTIYLASNGLGGSGGFDIFKSQKNAEGNWDIPVNLGAPINSATNQVSFQILPDGKTAFFASENADSYGGFDIYKVTYLGEEKPSYQSNSDELTSISQIRKEEIILLPAVLSTVLSGKITSLRTNAPISATIEIIDKEANKVVYSEMSDSKTGMYEISLPAGKNYSISVKSDSYMFASDNIEVQKTKKFQRFNRDFKLSPLEIGAAIVLKNIFFDSNLATLRPESYAELNILAQFIKNNPNVKVEISGHTDNIGSAFSNKKLSKDRAQSVLNYLESIGTDINKLISVGYGHTLPVADNKTKEGRQINRRVEAKIIAVD